MKHAFAILAAGAFLLFAGSGLRAAPVAPAGASAKSDIVLVAEGCGTGWHRGPYGGCRRNLVRAGLAGSCTGLMDVGA